MLHTPRFLAVIAFLSALPALSAAPGIAHAADDDQTTARELLSDLRVEDPDSTGYDGSRFGGWSDEDGDGCDTRSEVLQSEASGPVTYLPGCTPDQSTWVSPYDGQTVHRASELVIDHLVPTAEAWASGAFEWSDVTRNAFFNDLDSDYALTAVTTVSSQAKAAKDPAKWLPPVGSACDYVTHWVEEKWSWDLSVDTDELSAIQTVLDRASCGDAPIDYPPYEIDDSVEASLFITAYDGVIYEVTDGGEARAITFAEWRDDWEFEQPDPAPTEWLRYPWSPTLYAVTPWTGDIVGSVAHTLTYDEWRRAGSPSPRTSGWIPGTYLYKWDTSAEVFAEAPGPGIHKLTYAEWRATEFRPVTTQACGFIKLSWANDIGSCTASYPLHPLPYAQWAAQAFPTPAVFTRMAGDSFYRNAGNPTIYYSGPLFTRAITFAEWRAAGSPAPSVR